MADNKKKEVASVSKRAGSCESCEFYDYDEYLDAYVCNQRLDQDEMVDFLGRNTTSCPYYRYYDEYKSVHKQI